MNDSYFRVERIGKIGVNNVPTDTTIVVQDFYGTIVPLGAQVQDSATMTPVDIDVSIESSEKVEAEVNWTVTDLGSGITYRIVKTFPYNSVSRLWCCAAQT